MTRNWNVFRTMEMADSYDERVVGRMEPEDNNGVGVSTCRITDIRGWDFETALLDANGAYPVERYTNLKEAQAGHDRWVECAKTAERVMRLGTGDGHIPDEEIEIKRVRVSWKSKLLLKVRRCLKRMSGALSRAFAIAR